MARHLTALDFTAWLLRALSPHYPFITVSGLPRCLYHRTHFLWAPFPTAPPVPRPLCQTMNEQTDTTPAHSPSPPYRTFDQLRAVPRYSAHTCTFRTPTAAPAPTLACCRLPVAAATHHTRAPCHSTAPHHTRHSGTVGAWTQTFGRGCYFLFPSTGRLPARRFSGTTLCFSLLACHAKTPCFRHFALSTYLYLLACWFHVPLCGFTRRFPMPIPPLLQPYLQCLYFSTFCQA